jgi:hypothetical protein
MFFNILFIKPVNRKPSSIFDFSPSRIKFHSHHTVLFLTPKAPWLASLWSSTIVILDVKEISKVILFVFVAYSAPSPKKI